MKGISMLLAEIVAGLVLAGILVPAFIRMIGIGRVGAALIVLASISWFVAINRLRLRGKRRDDGWVDPGR